MEPESKTASSNSCCLTRPWPRGTDKKFWGFPTWRVKPLNTQVCRRRAPLRASHLCGQPLKNSNGNRKILSGSMTLAGTSTYKCSGEQNADGLEMILINIYHAQGTQVQIYTSWALVLCQQLVMLPNTECDLHNIFLWIMLAAFIMFPKRHISIFLYFSSWMDLQGFRRDSNSSLLMYRLGDFFHYTKIFLTVSLSWPSSASKKEQQICAQPYKIKLHFAWSYLEITHKAQEVWIWKYRSQSIMPCTVKLCVG